MTEDWRAVSTTPALLADIVGVMPAVLRLRYSKPRPAWRHRFVVHRWMDLVRRFAPEIALEAMKEAPEAEEPAVPHLTRAAVHAACLLEDGAWREALPMIGKVPPQGGARALLEGRCAFQRAEHALAKQRLEDAVEEASSDSHPLAVEVLAESLGFLLRFELVGGAPYVAVAEQLDALLEAHAAGFSQSAFRVVSAYGAQGRSVDRLDAAVSLARAGMYQRYHAPHVGMEDDLAPIPVVVHGVAKAHGRDPAKYFEEISTLSAMAWREGERQHGYDIAYYGRAIGERLFGPKMHDALSSYLEKLVAPVEPELRGVYEWRVQFRARMHAATLGA